MKIRSFLRLALFTVCVIGLSAFVTKSTLARIGPFWTTTLNFDSLTGGQVGCETRTYLAADSLRQFQVVQFTAKNTVGASATLADYNDLAGVVVGGARNSMTASFTRADSSTLMATANQRVIVCVRGRSYVLIDTVTGGIGPGVGIIPSLVAGRVKARSTAIDTHYRVFGKMNDTGIRNGVALANIHVK